MIPDHIHAYDPSNIEEVSMNWIGGQNVTKLEMLLNWVKMNKQFLKCILSFV